MQTFTEKYGISIYEETLEEQPLDFVNEDTGFVVSARKGKSSHHGWLSLEPLYLVTWLCKRNNLPRTDYYKTMEQAITACQKKYDADINYFI